MIAALGLFHPGTSVLHRIPAWCKLLALLVAAVPVLSLDRPWQMAAALAAVLLLFAVARIPARVAWAQVRPLRWLLLVVAILQVVLADWQHAVVVCGGLLVAVGLAAVVTLTTRVSEMLEVVRTVVRPLRRFGVEGDRVGLVLALTIRLVPVLVQVVGAAAEARKARGLGFSLRALVTPAVVRALRTADAIGEALVARGVDD